MLNFVSSPTHMFCIVSIACVSLCVGKFLKLLIVRISNLKRSEPRTANSLRNPLVEIFTLFLSLLVIQHFGVQPQTIPALLFTWSLIVIAFIDIENFIIPNCISFPLILLGLACNALALFQSFENALIGAFFGYFSLWAVLYIYKFLTKKEGLGFGDLKLLAGLGAWLGWQMLPHIILFASVSGAIFGIILILLRRATRDTPLPFGPFLASGGIIALFLLPRIY